MREIRRPVAPYGARRHLWLRPGEPLVCPNGHRLKHNSAILQHDALICQFTEHGMQGQCGARAYVLVMPGGLRFVAEVTSAEMLTMRDQAMSVGEAVTFLCGSAA